MANTSLHRRINVNRSMKSFVCLPFLVWIVASLIGGTASAEVRLPGFFGDHMVLQQNKPIRVWGWADDGEEVTVIIGQESVVSKADSAGKWKVELPAMKASNQPQTLTIKGSNAIEIDDVLIGEVWLCSGQSNMEWTVARSNNQEAERAGADRPTIRHFKVGRTPSSVPLDDIQADWQVCSSKTVGDFTACGYFMARDLSDELDVPIGLINTSWGGTRIEPWTPPIGFQRVDALRGIYDSVMTRTPGTESYRALLGLHIEQTSTWLDSAKGSLKDDQRASASPVFPEELRPFKNHQDPTMLYNAMVHALVGFPMRGVIWYQGEANRNDGKLYTEKQTALINGWRELWGNGDFPFYYVQIAPFQYSEKDPTFLAEFWEAQAAVQKLPNTGMVVTNDIATLKNIHPPNKQDVGHRFALLALANDYGRDVVANSPEMESMEVLPGTLRIEMKHAGGGLKTRKGGSPTLFEIAGPGSGGFQPADAKISGNAIELTSSKVAAPVAFRFAWDKLAEPNLMGGTGLPVGAFRGGEEPGFLDQVLGGADYRLIYDLDLSNLDRTISYAVDNSDHTDAFSRIGYLLELVSEDGGEQIVFVSMDAFTDSAKKIGVPAIDSGATFQQMVSSMDVYSTSEDIVTGTGIQTGNIEFWPNNYGQENPAGVKDASAARFDFGDSPKTPTEGYGCMQVHNFGAKQTVFAVNNWRNGDKADIGIGNCAGREPDWTFSANANQYTTKRLKVFVK